MTMNKTKSGLFETPRAKITPSKSDTGIMSRSSISETPRAKVTPRVSKFGRMPSKPDLSPNSPLQSGRFSIDRSPRSVASIDQSPRLSVSVDRSPKSVDSKLSIQHRTPRISTPRIGISDRQTQTAKESGLQEELNATQEDLKKAREKLVSLEKEKARALNELEEAKKQASEAKEKLTEALIAQKQAEEDTEIEKFRAVELEQAGIDAAQQREEAWQKELVGVQNQHSLEISNLLSATEELHKLKHELKMTTEAKNTATSHADDALMIAEINAEKVNSLSQEVHSLKSLLDSKVESKAKETAEQVRRLDLEIESLQCALKKAKEDEEKLIEMEVLIEGLTEEVADVKKAESDAQALADEWKNKSVLLGVQLEEAIQSEKLASESLASAVKQLQECNASLQDAESEIACLKGKVESLELGITRYKEDFDESKAHLQMVERENTELEKTIEVLEYEIQCMEKDKNVAIANRNQMSSNLPTLSDEKKRILLELEASKDEVEKTKKAMEGLSSAMHEVSTEARESQEKLLTVDNEFNDAKSEIEELKMTLKSTEEKYRAMLIEARDEVARLTNAVKVSEVQSENLKTERSKKEQSYISSLEKAKEEIVEIKKEMDKLVSKLKGAEFEAATAKEEEAHVLNRLKQAKQEAASASKAAEEVKAESLQLKERLLDKENELQSITQENDDLRAREEDAVKKIRELSTLLAEAKTKKSKDNGEVLNREKDNDVVSKTEFSDDTGGKDEAHKLEAQLPLDENVSLEKPKPNELNGNEDRKESDNVVESKKWESCKVIDKGSSPERETQTDEFAKEVDSKIENGNFNPRKGGISPSKEPQEKKKIPFLRKFGNFLKKKSNQK